MLEDSSFFHHPAEEVAPKLLGCTLEVVSKDGTKTGGIIVETEAYDQNDEASHTFRGKTQRNSAMFAEPGTVYVYMTYGMHLCMNFSVQEKDFGAGVLIRAIEPTVGIDHMLRRRFQNVMPDPPTDKQSIQLTNGPAKITQAMGITLADNFTEVNKNKRIILRNSKLKNSKIIQTTRIGIRKAADTPHRWYLADNRWVSKL